MNIPGYKKCSTFPSYLRVCSLVSPSISAVDFRILSLYSVHSKGIPKKSITMRLQGLCLFLASFLALLASADEPNPVQWTVQWPAEGINPPSPPVMLCEYVLHKIDEWHNKQARKKKPTVKNRPYQYTPKRKCDITEGPVYYWQRDWGASLSGTYRDRGENYHVETNELLYKIANSRNPHYKVISINTKPEERMCTVGPCSKSWKFWREEKKKYSIPAGYLCCRSFWLRKIFCRVLEFTDGPSVWARPNPEKPCLYLGKRLPVLNG